MQLAGLNEWVASLEDAAFSVIDWVGDKARAELQKWAQASASFRATLKQLEATPASSTESAARRNGLLTQAKDIVEKANWIDTALAPFREWMGLSGLGVVPLLVPAVIVAAIIAVTAIIYKWTDSVTSYLKEERLVKSGVPREQAQKQTASGGLFGDVAQLLWPVSLAGVALFLLSGRKKS